MARSTNRLTTCNAVRLVLGLAVLAALALTAAPHLAARLTAARSHRSAAHGRAATARHNRKRRRHHRRHRRRHGHHGHRPASPPAARTASIPPTAITAAPLTPFFSPTSFWNEPLTDSAALDADSVGKVAELTREVEQYGAWINTTQYSVPIYTVPADEPTQTIYIDTPNAMSGNGGVDELQQQLDAVPIPDGAQPAAGSDHHLVIWQPSTDTMWELWLANHAPDQALWPDETPDGWHAAWGRKITNVSTDPGTGVYPFGATASGLPLVGGLMRIGELQAGSLDHALAIAIPDVAANDVMAPATRTDGSYTGPNAIPEGQRFRLDPSLDVDSLGLSPVGTMIARAAQRYGLVVRDGTGGSSVVFYAEDPTPTGSNPYPALFQGQSPDQVLAGFPWNRLEALGPT